MLVARDHTVHLVLTRRVDRAGRERRAAPPAAVDASEAERVRIARDLHDGVVQDLAGSSFAISALAREPDGSEDRRSPSSRTAGSLRASMRALRSLLVEIYPPDLHAAGLRPRCTTWSRRRRPPASRLDVQVVRRVCPAATVALVWRVAQEAVRNVAAARRRQPDVGHRVPEGTRLVLEVADDGRASTPRLPAPGGRAAWTESLTAEPAPAWT